MKRFIILLSVGVMSVVGFLIPTSAVANAASSYKVETVRSNAMNKDIQVGVISAGVPNAPTVYLLDGLRAMDWSSGWVLETDAVQFFTNKGVNVAIPFGGGGTFYSDWQKDDPKLGHVRWATFITAELNNYMRDRHNADPRRSSIVGLSMSGTSALNLAQQYPGLYKSAVSLSGYPSIMNPAMQTGVRVSVAQTGGDSKNMWGDYYSSEWYRNDPLTNVKKFRDSGVKVYISSGYGVPNAENIESFLGNGQKAVDWFIRGGVALEQVSAYSNLDFILAARLHGVDMQTNMTAIGGHEWSQWERKIRDAWERTIRPSLF